MSAPSTTTALAAADGTKLSVRAWSPAGDTRGWLAIVHGYFEHGGRYARTAERFGREGLACLAVDVRGHGQSGGARGAIRRYGEYLDDLDVFLRHAATAAGGKPLYLLGHSHGALIVLRRLLATAPLPVPVAKVACTSPFLGVGAPVSAIKLAAGRLMSRIWPSLSLDGGLDPAWVSHDAEVVAEYAADPQRFKTANARWFTEASAAQDHVVKNAAQLPQPVLVVAAGADKIVDVTRTRALAQRAGERVRYVELDGFYHEVLNEVERERAFAELVPWFST